MAFFSLGVTRRVGRRSVRFPGVENSDMPACVPPDGTRRAMLGVANLARILACKMAHIAAMSARQTPTPRQLQLLNPTDPDESFIAEGIAFFFAEGTGRYQAMAARRVELGDPGSRRRVVVQGVRQRRGRGGRPGWFVMVWDVEGRGVTFLPQSCKAVMWERYREIGPAELRAVLSQSGGKQGT